MAIEIEHTLTKCWVTVTEPHTFLEHPAYYAGKDNDPHYPVPATLYDQPDWYEVMQQWFAMQDAAIKAVSK